VNIGHFALVVYFVPGPFATDNFEFVTAIEAADYLAPRGTAHIQRRRHMHRTFGDLLSGTCAHDFAGLRVEIYVFFFERVSGRDRHCNTTRKKKSQKYIDIFHS